MGTGDPQLCFNALILLWGTGLQELCCRGALTLGHMGPL